MAAKQGLEDDNIKTLGRWKSLGMPGLYEDSSRAVGSILHEAMLTRGLVSYDI